MVANAGGVVPQQEPLPRLTEVSRGQGRVDALRAGSALMLSLVAVLAWGCATEFPGDYPPTDELEYPAGLALHPDGRYLYVVNTNFDLQYRPQDGGTIGVIDLDDGSMLPLATRTFGSFASVVVLNHDASRGYIAVRGDSTVTWFALAEEGRKVWCPLDPKGKSLRKCSFSVPSEPTGLAYTRSSRTQTLLDAQGRPELGPDGQVQTVTTDFDLLAIAHLRGGLVSMATIRDTNAPAQKPAFSIASAALVDGPSDLALHSGERFYVSGRVASSVVGFRPAIGVDASVAGVYLDTVISVPTPYSAHEGRTLLFSENRDYLYLANQSPNSLIVFDTSAGDNDSVSGRHNRIVDMIDLPRNPNQMAWVERPGEGPLLYITCFDEDIVAVVDTSIPAIIAKAQVGDGPFDIVVDAENRQQAYVSNFVENSISVLDIAIPESPSEIQVIGIDASERD